MHVAIIMDGNGRWAERRGLARSAGHRAGARADECAPSREESTPDAQRTLPLGVVGRAPEIAEGVQRVADALGLSGEHADRVVQEIPRAIDVMGLVHLQSMARFGRLPA